LQLRLLSFNHRLEEIVKKETWLLKKCYADPDTEHWLQGDEARKKKHIWFFAKGKIK
jgi:hypothetical protein